MSVTPTPTAFERSITCSFNAVIGVLVVSAIVPTFAIAFSKSLLIFIAAVATPAIGRVTAFVNVAPAFAIVLPAFWICFPAFIASFPIWRILCMTSLEGLVKPSINCIAVLITLPTSTTSDRFLYFFVFFRFIPHFLPHICPRYALLSFRQAHVFKRFPIFKAIVQVIHVFYHSFRFAQGTNKL